MEFSEVQSTLDERFRTQALSNRTNIFSVSNLYRIVRV